VVRITKPKSSIGKFNKHRILTALLHAFQNIHPHTNIHQNLDTTNNTTKLLYLDTDIPTDDTIHHYLELQETPTQNDDFCARIILNCEFDLYTLKRNRELIQWLKSEMISIDRNPLQSILKPRQIGFLTHFMTRIDQTDLYEQLLRSQVSKGCPQFFIQAKHIKAGVASTRVWNVYACHSDIDEITKHFKLAYNNEEIRQFFP
jgi:hypothetical protein